EDFPDLSSLSDTLTSLNLFRTHLNDTTIRKLTQLPLANLGTLNMGSNLIYEKGIQIFCVDSMFNSLKKLNLDSNYLFDEDLLHFQHAKFKLEILHLNH